MGGNGILLENRVIKSMMDLEALYTYEGTYDINSLISGRELTGGLPAFKWLTKILSQSESSTQWLAWAVIEIYSNSVDSH